MSLSSGSSLSLGGIGTAGTRALGLARAYGEGQPLRLLAVVDLGREIVPPQRDAEQELHPAHDAVAIADAEKGFNQVQLEAANVVGRWPCRESALQLWMWLRCEWGQTLRAVMSSIMR